MNGIVRMCDISFDKELFLNFNTGTVLDKLLKLASSRETFAGGFHKFEEKALEACSTAVSLRELGLVNAGLRGPLIGLSPKVAAGIAPYEECRKHLFERGINVKGIEKQVKTGLTWWQLFNRLTEFATHSPCLAPDDILRGVIMKKAMSSLYAKHDIINYIEYD